MPTNKRTDLPVPCRADHGTQHMRSGNLAARQRAPCTPRRSAAGMRKPAHMPTNRPSYLERRVGRTRPLESMHHR
eukprot:6302318-Prymnesium_polylepis.1